MLALIVLTIAMDMQVLVTGNDSKGGMFIALQSKKDKSLNLIDKTENHTLTLK